MMTTPILSSRIIAGFHAARMFRTLKGSDWKVAAALVRKTKYTRIDY